MDLNILLSFLFVLNAFAFGQNNLELPPLSFDETINRDFYQLEYNEEHEQANWVYYRLDISILQGEAKRKDNFKEDSLITSFSASLNDYKGSGYDRGHLCPAGSMKINQKAMDQTFFMSNISPQKPGFNRGIWKQLEQLIRDWVYEYKEIHVVTGPMLIGEMNGTIGENNVSVPNFFYKVIYTPDNGGKMIGFILENQASNSALECNAYTVAKIQSLTNIDFFYELDNIYENKLESKIGNFNFKAVSKKIDKTKVHKTQQTKIYPKDNSFQCRGIAKTTGVRCLKTTRRNNQLCYFHQNQ